MLNIEMLLLVGAAGVVTGLILWRFRSQGPGAVASMAIGAIGALAFGYLVIILFGFYFLSGLYPLNWIAVGAAGAGLATLIRSAVARRGLDRTDALRLAFATAGAVLFFLVVQGGVFPGTYLERPVDLIAAGVVWYWLMRRTRAGVDVRALAFTLAAFAGAVLLPSAFGTFNLRLGFGGELWFLNNLIPMTIGAVLFVWLLGWAFRRRDAAFIAPSQSAAASAQLTQRRQLWPSPPAAATLVQTAADTGPAPSPSAPVAETPQEKIFISYRREDSLDVTGRLYDRLTREYGEKAVFRDLDSVELGRDFRKSIDKLISECTVCIVVIGNRWLTVTDRAGGQRLGDPRDHVRIEIETALKRDVRVVPLLVGGAPVPALDELPDSLHDLAFRNGIPIRPDPDFHRDVDRLIAGLKSE